MLTALVLLATPLHDAVPPPPREEAAVALGADAPAAEARLMEREIAAAAMPRAVAKRRRVTDADVPTVIYETRRTRLPAPVKARPADRGSAPAVMASHAGDTWLRQASMQSP